MERAIYVLAAAIVIAGIALGGIYERVGSGGNGIITSKVNRFTGQMTTCLVQSGEMACFSK